MNQSDNNLFKNTPALNLAAFCCLVAALLLIPASRVSAQWIDNGVPVSTTSELEEAPQIVSDGNGGAIMAWSRNSTDRDIYAQKISADGVVLWTIDGIAVCTASGEQWRLRMIGDGEGGAIIAWEDSRTKSWDLYAQRIDADGNTLWLTDGIPVCTAASGRGYLRMVSDGNGGALLAWVDERSGEDKDIYAQRLDSNGNPLWQSDGAPVTTRLDYEDLRPKLASDGTGGAMVTWYSYNYYEPHTAHCARLNNQGAVLWTAGLTAVGLQLTPFIAGCPGGAIVVWVEEISADYNIYAQKFDTLGVKQWDPANIPVCTLHGIHGYKTLSDLIPDGYGGVIVSWGDFRDGECKIYVRRLSADGDTLWAPQGTPVCTSAGDQGGGDLASDGAGGAITTWYDVYLPSKDIYAQSIDSDGNCRWGTAGITVCSAPETQTFPCITGNGAGSSIIAWQDYRSAVSGDIYAQYVRIDGTTDSEGEGAPLIPFTLHQNRPNPFNPSTEIGFSLPGPSTVTLDIYDISGKRVRRLLDEKRPAGNHLVHWDGLDDNGSQAVSGVYFYRLTAEKSSHSRKMILLR